MDDQTNRTFSFPPFTLDTETGKLSSGGRNINLPAQATQLLTLLVERPGVIVRREEIQAALWPEGISVNFDRSINKLISLIRYALRDDPRSPQFLETIPQRGYRFIAEVIASPDLPQILTAHASRSIPDSQHLDAPHEPVRAALVSVEIAALQARMPRSWHRVALWGLAVILLITTMTAGIFWKFRSSHARSSPSAIRVGIVPLDADSDEAAQLGSSFRLELADALSQLPGVQVRAAHSVANQKWSEKEIRQLGEALNLDVLLVGSFHVKSGVFQLALELVRCKDSSHLASLQYSGSTAELTTTRDRIQRDIFTRLEGSPQRGNAQQGSTANPQAYEAYLRGRFFLEQRTDEALSRALQEFQSASRLDPQFARAYAGLASTYILLAEHNPDGRTEDFRHADALAAEALRIYPDLAEAHAVAGYVLFRWNWKFQPAEHELRRAIELDSNEAVYHIWLALLLSTQGRSREGLQEIDKAHADDPSWPAVDLSDAYVSSCARDWARTLKTAEHLVRWMPNWAQAHEQFGDTLWYAGSYEEAIAEWRMMATIEKDTRRVNLEDRGLAAFKKGGVPAYARVRLSAMRENPHWAHANADFDAAEWEIIAGENDAALKELQRLVDQHDPDSVELAVAPAYDKLHKDPRFTALLTRVGLPLPLLPTQTIDSASR